jgi:argininosuccinate lyase
MGDARVQLFNIGRCFSNGIVSHAKQEESWCFVTRYGKSDRIFGHLLIILTVMKRLPLGYHKDMQEDKGCFFDTVATLATCLEAITPFLKSIWFDIEVTKEAANSESLDATSMRKRLASKGMPFRDAHCQVGKWVAEAEEKKIPFKEVHGIMDDDQRA